MKAPINIENIVSYIVGTVRLWLINSRRFYPLVPIHIREQFYMRVDAMKPDCYNQGHCVLCGCSTPALQLANKPCDNPCYPAMMNKRDWDKFKKGVPGYDQKTNLVWWMKKGELINYKTEDGFIRSRGNNS